MDTKSKATALAIAGGLVTVSGCILKKAFPKIGWFVSGYGLAHLAIAGMVMADEEYCLTEKAEDKLECVTKAIKEM